MDVTLDRYSASINGKREFILSGAIHYYRLPSKRLWPRRLALIKEAGLNAVDIYYAWNYHSTAPGEYDFSGIRDVEYLHDCIEKAGLYLIARPGPYICSEVDGGGFPGWLLARRNITLRCRDGAGGITLDNEYMDFVREWFEQIVPRILSCKNLILLQVENEFMTNAILQGPVSSIIALIRKFDPTLLYKLQASQGLKFLLHKLLPEIRARIPQLEKITGDIAVPNPYIAELYRMARRLGATVPIFHNDVLNDAERVAEVDLAAIDDYALNMVSDDWRGKPYTFASTDAIEAGHDKLQFDKPIFIAEFQGSWFDIWGGRGYDHVRKIFGTDQLDIATKTALAQRATLINYFMFSGGTSWGYIGSPDVYTSYDLASPVSESGQRTDRFHAVKWLAEKIHSLGPDFLCTEHDETIKSSNPNVNCRARKSLDGIHYVFLRNLTLKRQKTRVNIEKTSVILEPVSMVILVFSEAGALIETIGPYNPATAPARKTAKAPKLPELENWSYSNASPQLSPDYDDSRWTPISSNSPMDMDWLGHHYGFIWYRGTYTGLVQEIKIDARHFFSVWLNGRLVGSRDNFKNKSGAGPDLAETYTIPLPADWHRTPHNTLLILVESMGHHKDFECDARNPRGIIALKVKGHNIDWRFRSGLLPGETGLCPVLAASSFKTPKKSRAALPHFWQSHEEGIGLYETKFNLQDRFDEDKHALGLVIPDAYNKANIYLNGALIGRYWNEKGPQHKFYLPWGILKTKGENRLAVAIWKMWNKGGLGRVRLELY